MNNELEKIWKETGGLIKVLSRHLSGRTEENREKPESGQSV
jgi:hypothetical protein